MTYATVTAWLSTELPSWWTAATFLAGTTLGVVEGHGTLSLLTGALTVTGLLAAGRLLARYHTGRWLGEATDLTDGETHA